MMTHYMIVGTSAEAGPQTDLPAGGLTVVSTLDRRRPYLVAAQPMVVPSIHVFGSSG
jgi:hypothetical protein